MQNKFCKALSNAVSFRIPGDSNSLTFNPCCLYDEYLPFHPTFFKKQRQKFIDADKEYLTECSKCALKEKTHGLRNTQRVSMNQKIPDDIGNDIYKLEIVLDTTCNAACIQCGPTQSSLWRNELMGRAHNYIHIQPVNQIDSKIETIKQNVDIQKVKIWHFWGGEPLLTDTHMKLLTQIEDLSTVTLTYTTNGSIFPDEDVLELWSKCKHVTVNISTDGVENKFHYIRWPLQWSKWVQTAERLKNETPSNIDLCINYCVLPLNALYTNELEDWLSANFNKNKNGRLISLNCIRGEGILDIACTPQSLREEIWKRLGENHVVSNLLKEIPVQDPTAMITYLEKWDNYRKLDWQKVFPEIVAHF